MVWQLKLFLGEQLNNCLLSFFLQQTLLPFGQSINVFSTSFEVLKFFELKVNRLYKHQAIKPHTISVPSALVPHLCASHEDGLQSKRCV